MMGKLPPGLLAQLMQGGAKQPEKEPMKKQGFMDKLGEIGSRYNKLNKGDFGVLGQKSPLLRSDEEDDELLRKREEDQSPLKQLRQDRGNLSPEDEEQPEEKEETGLAGFASRFKKLNNLGMEQEEEQDKSKLTPEQKMAVLKKLLGK